MSNYEAAYKRAVEEVERVAGHYVRRLVGPTLYRALVAERLLDTLAGQDDSIPPENIVAMLNGVHGVLCDDPLTAGHI